MSNLDGGCIPRCTAEGTARDLAVETSLQMRIVRWRSKTRLGHDVAQSHKDNGVVSLLDMATRLHGGVRGIPKHISMHAEVRNVVTAVFCATRLHVVMSGTTLSIWQHASDHQRISLRLAAGASA